jgi:hypothetical protein
MLKKIGLLMAFLAIIFMFAGAGTALAGGDKVHGDKTAGTPPQFCNEFGVCPWED